jgi:hypothetical protein
MDERTVDLRPEADEKDDAEEVSSTPVVEASEEAEMMKETMDGLRKQAQGMEYTIERLEEASDKELVMQKLEGGVLVEVPPEDRDRVLEKLTSAHDELSSRLDEHQQKFDDTSGGAL